MLFPATAIEPSREAPGVAGVLPLLALAVDDNLHRCFFFVPAAAPPSVCSTSESSVAEVLECIEGAGDFEGIREGLTSRLLLGCDTWNALSLSSSPIRGGNSDGGVASVLAKIGGTDDSGSLAVWVLAPGVGIGVKKPWVAGESGAPCTNEWVEL